MYPRSNLKLGDWKATCDRCGFDYHASQLRKTWDSWYVCKECYEPRHSLDNLQGVPDDPSVPWVRNGTPATTSSYTDVAGNSVTTINTARPSNIAGDAIAGTAIAGHFPFDNNNDI